MKTWTFALARYRGFRSHWRRRSCSRTFPLPAKIGAEVLDPIHLDTDPERADDADYFASICARVEAAIQAGMPAHPPPFPDLLLIETKGEPQCP